MRFERRGFSGGGRRSFGGDRRFGRSDDRDRGSDLPKPVKVGEEYDVEISEVGSRGDGIARVKNFVVFVNGAKQGEKAKVKITEVRERFAIGEKVGEATGAVESASAEGSEETEETEEAPAKSETSEETETEAATEESESPKFQRHESIFPVDLSVNSLRIRAQSSIG